ncbi:uncharacterized protein TM35_000342240 [Trypanosoma theileri]|uniref:Uncharacterized protein n=1 Tax=Trypanosoma theileri TaxID=67003 RepID=A0A1X0NLG6_9TRYP|nr:uncharacterized protein TM35_000342240 [Trypanosoma theileri]ORC85612.1 hypothetical protein TM35_000342240 [Trypanosoma theileri]
MISLNFTLYRFVSDPAGFHNLPNLDSLPFLCEWAPLPRNAHSHSHSQFYSRGRSGSTAPAVFAPAGDSMALGLSGHNASLELDPDTDVIAFVVRAVHQHKPESVLARGTLDPVPFIGRPLKSYAIKLRDAAGDVVGRLLFSMEVREAYQFERPVEVTAVSGTSVEANRLRKDRKTIEDIVKNENKEKKSGGINGNSNGIGDNNTNSKENNDKDRINTNLDHITGSMPYKTKDISSKSPPYSATTQCNSLETSPSRDNSQNRGSTNIPGNISVNGVKKKDEKKSDRLLIDIERVIIKKEAINLDNPAPLLLGGMYYAKVRYGENTLCTPAVECRSPKEIVYSSRVSFEEIPDSGDKIRFSIWEDERQVAGFSLDPSKFRVTLGGHKEYSIPFRYYPTRQAASLEVTVHRVNSELKNDNDNDVGLVAKRDASTRQPSPEQQEEEEALEPPPSLPTPGTVKYEDKRETPLQTNTPSLASRVEDKISSAPHSLSSRETSNIGHVLSAKDYVRKRYSSPTVRQSHWDNGVQKSSDSNIRNQEKEKPIQDYKEEQQQQSQQHNEDRNQSNMTVPPSPKVMLDARQQQEEEEEQQQKQHERYNHSIQQKQKEQELLKKEEAEQQQQQQQQRRRPQPQSQSQSQRRTGDALLSRIRQSERRNDSENVNRVQAFLNQISQSGNRSSSATRQPTEGLEVPQLTPGRREPSSKLYRTADEMRWSERNHTPLRSHHSGPGGAGPNPNRPNSGRQPSEWNTSDIDGRSRSRMAWQQRIASVSETPSDRASASGIADSRERLADSLLSRLERPPGFRTSLMEEWLEWREARGSARVSRASSTHSTFSRDDSIASIASRNRATSPLPTKTVADAAEQRPYQPVYTYRSPSTRSSLSGRPPMPMR